ncbi:MAG: hypothetical protein H0X14_13610, partial [Acidobacteria bacterium]|nr:hypothetical protein [Acidobacteriota bacterium]
MPGKLKVLETLYRAGRDGSKIWRIVAAILLLCAMSIAASAYTVVMRGGRRIEIPESFIVTRATLSYEAAPGIGVTLQMSTIDIPATERINSEPAGSLLQRAGEQPAAALRETGTTISAAPSPRPRRTITNRDLEAARRAREKSEVAYERRAKELGLPSLEDARRRSDDESRRLKENARLSEESEAQAEVYWRGRAAELRTEFAALDAQINYLRNHLAQSSRPLTISSYTTVAGVWRLFPIRRRMPAPYITHGPPLFGSTGTGAQAVAVIGFGGGSSRSQVLVNPASPVDIYGRQSASSGPWGIAPFFAGYPADDSSYERSVLVTRLRELESVRAGLDARWRL